MILLMLGKELAEGIGPDEGAIAAKDEGVARRRTAGEAQQPSGLHGFLTNQTSMTSAFLLGLHDPGDIRIVFVSLHDPLFIMADDDEELGDPDLTAGIEHVTQHGTAADFVQNLDPFGLHASGFAGGEDDGGECHEIFQSRVKKMW